MPVYQTPFGPVDAPSEQGRDAWVAKQQASQGTPSGSPPSESQNQQAQNQQPAQSQSAARQPREPSVWDQIWKGISFGWSGSGEMSEREKRPIEVAAAIPARAASDIVNTAVRGFTAPGRAMGGLQTLAGRPRDPALGPGISMTDPDAATRFVGPTAMLMAGRGEAARNAAMQELSRRDAMTGGPGGNPQAFDLRPSEYGARPDTGDFALRSGPAGGKPVVRATPPQPVPPMQPTVRQAGVGAVQPPTVGIRAGPPPTQSDVASGMPIRVPARTATGDQPRIRVPATTRTTPLPMITSTQSATAEPVELRREPSDLASAIATGDNMRVDRTLSRATDRSVASTYRKAIAPPRGSRWDMNPLRSLREQDRAVVGAIDAIIANRAGLEFPTETGLQQRGRLPRSIREFADAVNQTKRSIFEQYDMLKKSANDAGLLVPTAPIAARARELAANAGMLRWDQPLVDELLRIAKTYEEDKFITPTAAQDEIEFLNRKLSGTWAKMSGGEPASRADALAAITQVLRGTLDETIANAGAPQYRVLRDRYGQLRQVEREVARAVAREANSKPGLIDLASDIWANEEILYGVLTGNADRLLRAGAIKAARAFGKYVNDPNRAIKRLFESRAGEASLSLRARAATNITRGVMGQQLGAGGPPGVMGGISNQQIGRTTITRPPLEFLGPTTP